ncbi:ATP-binding protein [Caenispirillum bisanense]|uniref:ATP-binding protein n=1 Tax=Caenispirillum bisanense TaxID=414052 RepID=UPI0031E18649
MSSAAQASPQTLFRWIWRSYARTALVPLLAVELLLIGAYFSTNLLTKNANIASIRATAEQSLQEVARLNAVAVDEKLQAVTSLTDVLRRQVEEVQGADPRLPVPADEAGRFTFDPTGVVYYTRDDVGRGAGFYSGAVPVTPEMQQKALDLAALDPILRDVTHANPLVVQSYYNTWDSYNRIFPFFDTLSQYAPRLDIPSFNFYYEADAAHNPDRRVVWTDAYVDPAGQGWLISAIAPVYGGDDVLEGVVGLDITIDTIVKRILDIRTPWGGYAVMVGRDGTILAMPPAAEESLGLREVGKHTYEEAVRSNTFKPEDYSLARIADLSRLPVMDGEGSGSATLLDEPHLVAWQAVPATDWHLIVFVPERDLFAAAIAVGDRFDRLGYAMVAALVVFYALFFTVLWFSARRHAHTLAQPLEAVATAAGNIARGDFRQTLPPSAIREVAAVGRAVVDMGGELGDKTARLMAASRSLEESDAFRRALIENLPVPVVLYRAGDPDVVIAHNSAYDALVAEVGHTPLHDALLACDGGQEEGTLALTLGEPARRYSGRFTRLAHGGERGVLCVLLDVTVLEEARRQIAEARDRALEAARVKSEFLAKVSHELRTPLNGIIGLAEVCSHETDPARMQRSIGMIGQSGQALLGLVEDLLTMSSLDTGTLVLDRRWVVPATLLEELVDGFRGLTLALLPGPGLQLRVLAAGQQVRQVITHLVANALKFTERGSVAVVADVVGGDGDAATLTVVVEDTGIGLPDGPLEALFEPFHQGENGLDRRYGGFGLGLAVARDLAERMGGSLTAQRRSPSGSRFTLTVPVTVDSGAGVRPPPPVARALVCGFDRTTEALLVAILGKLDLPVDTAPAGEAARALSPQGSDLVILPAMSLADVDGLRRLLSAHADLRVLAVTDPATDEVTERLSRLAIPALPLPVTPRSVEAAVEPFRLLAPSNP